MVINQNKQTGHMKCYNGQLEEKPTDFQKEKRQEKIKPFEWTCDFMHAYSSL